MISNLTTQISIKSTIDLAAYDGELVVINGIYGTGKTMLVEEILRPKELERKSIEAMHFKEEETNKKPLQIMIFSGPYAQSDGVHYIGIESALNQIKNDQPNIVIFMGPFIDEKNEHISSGEVKLGGNYLSFHQLMEGIIDRIKEATSEFEGTKIIIQSSPYDALGFNCLPQPPLHIHIKDTEKFICVPNPYLLRVFDFSILLCNYDLPSIVSSNTHMLNGKENKISPFEGAAMMMLASGISYPIFPPFITHPIDFGNWEDLVLQNAPDVIVMPSVQYLYANKYKEKSIIINPGSAVKGDKLGSFATLTIHKMDMSIVKNSSDNQMLDRTRVDILKLK